MLCGRVSRHGELFNDATHYVVVALCLCLSRARL